MKIGFDMDSYVMGKKDGKTNVVFPDKGVTFTDPNDDGNIIVTEKEEGEGE